MTMPRPSFADVNKEDLVKNGTYHAKIRKFETREPKDCRKEEDPFTGRIKFFDEKGDEKFMYDAVDFVIQNEGEYFGRHIFTQLTWKPGGMYLTRQLNQAIGLVGDAADAPTENDYLDKEVLIVVTTQEGRQGYPPRNNVQRILKLEF